MLEYGIDVTVGYATDHRGAVTHVLNARQSMTPELRLSEELPGYATVATITLEHNGFEVREDLTVDGEYGPLAHIDAHETLQRFAEAHGVRMGIEVMARWFSIFHDVAIEFTPISTGYAQGCEGVTLIAVARDAFRGEGMSTDKTYARSFEATQNVLSIVQAVALGQEVELTVDEVFYGTPAINGTSEFNQSAYFGEDGPLDRAESIYLVEFGDANELVDIGNERFDMTFEPVA